MLADGSSRPLQKGEILQPGAKLNIADDAKLILAPYDESPAAATPDAPAHDAPAPGQPQAPDAGTAASPDIAALQKSILQGVDPTQNFEASAAGGAPAAGGGGGIGGVAGASGNGGFVTIDRIGDATIAAAGFDTTYQTEPVVDTQQVVEPLLVNELTDQGEQLVVAEDGVLNGNLLDNTVNTDGPSAASVLLFSWGGNANVAVGTSVTIDGIGTLVVNGDGSFTFTPAPNYDGAVPPVVYTVTDGTDTVQSTLELTITPVNDLADQGENVVVTEDAAVSGNLLDNTVDNDGPQAATVTGFSWGGLANTTLGTPVTLAGVGTLLVNADGSYQFTPATNYDGPVPAVSYTVTDGTDSVQSILTITIIPVDEPVELAGLQLEGGELTLNEASLAGGSNPNAAAVTQSGIFTFSAADGVQSLTLGGVALVTNGQAVTAFPQTIISPLGNQLIVTGINYNPVTGTGSVNYSYTLGGSETHTQPANDNSLSESFSVVLVDTDGDNTSGSLDVVILDDVPSVTLTTNSEGLGSVSVDESLVSLGGVGSDGVASATLSAANVQAQFNPAFGADGAGSIGYSLALTGTNVASGLYAVDPAAANGQGAAIVLNQVGNVITGSAGGVDYFTLTINPSTGEVTLALLDNVWHGDTTNADDSVALTLGQGVLTLVQTVTDADGDSASASVDLGANGVFRFEDDGPRAGLAEEAPRLGATVDESLVSLGGVGGDGVASATLSAANVQAQFNPAFGADGAGSIGYSLALTGTNVASGLYAVDPLAANGQGAAIVLNQVGNVITGSAGGVDYFTLTINPSTGEVTLALLDNVWHGDTTNADDSVALTLGQGVLTLVQTVTDADGDSASASVDLGANGVFRFEDDGPRAGLAVEAPRLGATVDESLVSLGGVGSDGVASATLSAANVQAQFAPAFGADGAGSIGYSLALTGTNVASGLYAVDPAAANGQGAAIVLNQVGNVITGSAGGVDYFTLTINPSTGEVTLALLDNVWHGDTTNADDSVALTLGQGVLTLVQTVTDADGDSASASVDLGANGVFRFEDDGPRAGLAEEAPRLGATVDESLVSLGGVGGDGVASATLSAANVQAQFNPAFGADGAGSIGYSLALTGTNVASGLYAVDPLAANGQGAAIVLNQVGNVITGSAGGVDYFTLTINPSTGEVTLALLDNVWHGDTTNADDSVALTLGQGVLTLVQTVTDADGDSASASVDLGANGVFRFEDDGPRAGLAEEAPRLDATVDESLVSLGGVGGDGVASATLSAANVQAQFNPAFGADGAGSIGYSLALTGTNVASGLYAVDPLAANGQGAAIVLNQVGNVITGSAGGVDYFTLTINPSTGEVTLALLDNVWHGDTTNADDSVALTLGQGVLTLVQTVTDADGDSASASVDLGANGVFRFEDDGPRAGLAVEAPRLGATVDESLVSLGGVGSDGVASATLSAANVQAQFAPAFGADGAGSIGYSLALTGTNVASGLYAVDPAAANGQGAAIVLNQVGNVITGSAGGVDYFTLTINPSTGEVTLALLDNVWHGDTTNADDSVALTLGQGVLTLVQTVTDADGDSASASVDLGANGVFRFEDDGPRAGLAEEAPRLGATVDESLVSLGGVGGDGVASATLSAANVQAQFNPAFGADGAGSIGYSLALTGTNVASGLYAVDPLAANGQGAAIVLNQVGNVITGSAGGVDYFTLTINPSTGEVTLALLDNVWHGDTTNADDSVALTLGQGVLTLVQTVTDADGDSASASVDLGANGVFRFEDDGPRAGLAEEAPRLGATVDESLVSLGGVGGDGVASATLSAANVQAQFNPAFGADGAGSIGYSLALTGTNVASGLYAVDPLAANGQGAAIVLNQVGNVITGSAGGVDYFTLTINPSTGEVTLALLDNVWHGDTTNADDSVALTLGQGVLTLVQTVTDADGDSASASVDLGANGVFRFEDDGPRAGLAVEAPRLGATVDESLVSLGGVGGDGVASATLSAANVQAQFNPAFGADGAGSIGYSLALTGTNVASGLYAVDPLAANGQGAAIVLNQVGNVITGSAGGVDYFTLTINPSTGEVTLALLDNVWHGDTTNADDSVALTLGQGVLTLVQTVTDADGDSASASVDLGANGVFRFEDDGPRAGLAVEAPRLGATVDESLVSLGGVGSDGVASATLSAANVQAQFAPAFGADGAGSIGYSLALTGTNVASGLYAVDPAAANGQGAAIVLNQVGNVITGSAGGVDYFTLTINPSTGEVTLALLDNVWHGDTTNADDSVALTLGQGVLTLVQTVTDADGDSASASVDLGANGVFRFEDDGPRAGLAEEAPRLGATVDESLVSLGGVGSDGVASASLSAANVQAQFNPAFGADGAGSIGYSLALTGTNVASGLYAVDPAAANGQGAAIVLNQVGNVITGSAGGVDYFTLTINPSTGEVTLALLDNVWHGDTTNADDSVALTLGQGVLTLVQTVTDADGDSASASVDLGANGVFRFEDDGPSVTINAVADSGITLTTQDAQTIGSASDTATGSFAAAFLAAAVPSYGADGPGTTTVSGYSLSVTDSNSGLTSNGLAITLTKVGSDIVGSTTAGEVFRISVASNGTVTLTQSAELDHLPEDVDNSNDNNLISLANGKVLLSATVTVVDGDNDTATGTVSADLGGNIRFEDDVPSVTINAVADSGITLTTQDAQTIGSASDTATGSFAAAFLAAAVPSYGADGPGTTTVSGYSLSVTDSNSGLTSNGLAITLTKVGSDIVGSTTAGEVFRISVASNGTVTLTQSAELDHLPEDVDNSNDNNLISLANGKVLLSATVTVVDGDNDTATGTVSADLGGNIRFEDDVPSVTINAVADSGITLTTQDAQTIGSASDTATGSFAAAFLAAAVPSYGADGPGTTTVSGYSLSVTDSNSGLTSNGLAITLTKVGSDIVGSTTAGEVFRISVASNGTVTLTQSAELDHLPEDVDNSNDNNLISLANGKVLLSATVTVVDGDNDTATGTVSADLGGNIRFEDDVPSVTINAVADSGITLTTQDAQTIGSASDTATGSFAAAFLAAAVPSYGADGPGTTTVSGYSLSVTDSNSGLTSNGLAITLTKVGSDIVGSTTAGEVFRISVASNGTVTLTQSAELDHLPEDVDNSNDNNLISLANGKVLLSATVTVVDGDNDTATGTVSADLGGNIRFEDDVPSVTINAVADSGITLTTQDAQTIGSASDTATGSFAAAFLAAAVPSYGADGPGTTTVSGYSLSVTDSNSGLTSNGLAITLTKVGSDIVGSTTAGEVFRISVASNGTVTLTQSAELDHLPEDVDNSNDNNLISLANGKVLLSATVTVVDGDNDTATGTVSADLGGNIRFEDDVPSVTINAVADSGITLTTQDAQTIGSASDTATGSFAAAFLAAAVPSYGADGPGTTTVSGYSLSVTDSNSGLTSNGLAITLTKVGSDIVGSTTAGEVFRISVASNGTVTLTQSAELDHLPEDVDNSNDNNLISLANGKVLLSATVTVVDGDNDTATGTVSADLGGNIRFEDDVPSVTINAVADSGITLTTQDAQTIGSASDTATGSFAAAFLAAAVPSYGADGPGTTTVSGYSLSVTDSNSGLTSNGLAITLTKVGSDIVGSTTAGEVFRISVASNGTVTLTQSAELDHLPEDVDNSNDNNLISLANGKVLLSATVTVVDGDNDTATGTVSADLGGNIRFEDDVPSVTINAVADSGITLTTQDAQTIGSASDTATGSFAAAFLAAAVPSYGADGPGTTTVSGYSLSVTDSNSGLTSNGLAITLTKVGSDIVGSTTAGEVFRISVASNGTVTLTQSAELDHLPEDVDNSNDNNLISLANGKVLLSATVTVVDGDNDTATGTVSADLGGNIRFEDDVPSVTINAVADSGITLTTQDAQTIGSASDTATGSFAAAFLAAAVPSYGADGPGTTTVSGYSLSVTDSNSGLTSNGLAITLTKVGSDIVGSTTAGEVFRISVASNGTVTLTQSAELDHLPEDVDNSNDNNLISLANGKVLLSATVTVVDGDNDTATGTVSADLGGNIRFEDDVPSVTINAVADSGITLTTQDAQTIGSASDTATGSFAAAFLAAAVPSYGADGPGTTTVSGYSLSVTDSNSGLTSNGLAITLTKVGSDIVGSTTAGEVFRISVASNGTVTLTQSAELDHLPEDVDNSNDNNLISLANGKVLLSATVTVVDGDNDTATGTVSADLGGNIRFEDDVPSVTINAVADSSITLTTQDAQTIGSASDTATGSFAAAFLAAAVPSYGADGPGTTTVSGYSLSVTDSNSGLTSNGLAITLTKVGSDIVGSTTAGEVFRISVASNGTVTLTQSAELDHLPEDVDNSNDNNLISLANGKVLLSATVTVVDGDNDTATGTVSADLGGNIRFEDDVPSVTINAVADSGITLTTQDAQTIGSASDTATGSFAAAFLAAAVPSYGADGPGTTTVSGYSLSVTDSNSGLTSNGLAITLTKVGSDIVGSTTAGEVFRISVASNGTVTLTQSAELDHLPETVDNSNDNNLISLANGKVLLSATVTVVDGDNDTATGTVSADLGGNIRFEDDVPSVTINAVADSSITLTTQDAQTIGSASDTATGSFAAAFLAAAVPSYGADGPGTTTVSGYSLSVTDSNSGLTSNGLAITLTKVGSDIVGSTTAGEVFRISVASNGTVTLTQSAELDHLPEDVDNSNDNNLISLANGKVLLSATVTVVDGDNDTATGTVSADLGGNIRFEDDVPTANPVTNAGQATQVQNTNLMLILDISGSMDYDSGYQGMTRMQVMQKSALELLDKYSAYGNVMVNIITFATSATNPTGVWVNVDTAKAIILGLVSTDSTNYDDALNEAIKAFGDTGKLANAQNVSYFMSDGEPNANALSGSPATVPDGNNSLGGGDGIDGDGTTLTGEAKDWADFLKANDINSFALGMGSGSTASALDPIAYNGVSEVNTTSLIVTDFSQLAATLLSTVVAPPLSGQLLNGGLTASTGADGGWIGSITVAGVTYHYDQKTDISSVTGGTSAGTFNTATNEWSISVAGGILKVDMDNGAYTFTPPSVIPSGGISQVFGYNVIDHDGDTAASTLSLIINPAIGPTVVRDDFVITNQDPSTIPDWALLANDTGPLAATQVITGVSGAVGGTVTDGAGSIVFDDTSGSATPSTYDGSFNYTNSTTTDPAKVFVDVQSGSTLTGSYLDEILIGGSGNDTLNGNAGNDILLGGAGNDSLNGGEGNDILVGGAGNDTLNGGSGNDTASYLDSTAGVTVTVNGNNQITGGAGTDSLSNMENLIGSMFNDSLTGDGNANVLSGLAGNDILIGGGGDDMLIGGAGSDTMTGGTGKDTFKWMAGDAGGIDTIKDFTTGANGDVLDLSELLSGEHTNAATLDQYFNFASGPGSNKSTLTIDLDGSGSASTTHTIFFDNVDLTLGGTRTDQQIIQDLLDQGNLKVDP
ncbi:retention module-containing protein [Aeromonas hydrophila]